MKFRFGSVEKYEDEIRKCERLLDMVRSRMADTESYYNYAPGGTYIIKGIYAVKETVDIAKEK